MKLIGYAILFILMIGSSSLVFAQTVPPCSTAAHSGASYETCTAGMCERMVCNGTAYVPLNVWSHAGWEAIKAGPDTSVCNPSREGRLRYQGSTQWEYCNGTSWIGW
jgi:hypothetical protein